MVALYILKKPTKTSNFRRNKILIILSTIIEDEYEYSSKSSQIYSME